MTRLEETIEQRGATHTAREIAGQPELWAATAAAVAEKAGELGRFLREAYAEVDDIVLTGAGTSAFIGLSLRGLFTRKTGIRTRAIATTDIVSHPEDFFRPGQKSLVISFARSGNSPESCAALQLADKFSGKCHHLIVTCAANGALAGWKSRNPVRVFVLPEAANDKSLAMTGSYSSMLLTGLLLALLDEPEEAKEQLRRVIAAGRKLLDQANVFADLAKTDFRRAVFLGSGPLAGTATESALKLQELTDGQVICKSDTYLGLRHGPKAVIDEHTLVVYFFSNSAYVKKYEADLVQAMREGSRVMTTVGIGESQESLRDLDIQVTFGNGEPISEDFLPVCAVVAGQLLGFFKSLACGLMPDAPSVNGAISRVVQGVRIYPVKVNA